MGKQCKEKHLETGVGMEKFDVLVIGGGPAGVSASIYAKRSGVTVCVFDMNESKLEKASLIENYYGVLPVSGSALKKTGLKQAKMLGIEVVVGSVDFVSFDFEKGCFVLKANQKEFEGKTLIIASGDKKIEIDERLKKYENKNMSSCAICDGYFYKNKAVGVLGNGTYAMGEAEILSQVAKNVFVFTNGQVNFKSHGNVEVVQDAIEQFVGNEKLEKIVTKEKTICLDGLFLALETMGASDIAKKLGVLLKDGNIVVDEKCKTNVKGVFACGDVTGGIKQVATAVYQGMIAGLESAKLVKNL